ncbi:MAG: DUF2149 domain-containing protein [Pseudoflavonifractor sp.]
MLRSSGLGGQRRSRRQDTEVNPMEGVANLADVMLVLACGLMISVITFWKVDLSRVAQVVSKEDLVEIKDVEKAIQDGSLSESLESKGIAYEDPESGKMYIIMP